MNARKPLLETRALAVGHGQRTLFGGLNIAAYAGDVWCVLGPNGGGKTTLFRTLLGLLPVREGEVTLGGDPLFRLGALQRARRVAYVPQSSSSHFALRARDVVLMGRTAHLGLIAAPRAQDHAAAEMAMDELGIAQLSDRTLDTLSGGEQRLVLIARALAQEAPLLLLDEPAAHLDIAHQALILTTIRRLANGVRAVLFTSHDPAHALEIATSVLLVGGHAPPCHGAPQDLLTATHLTALYRKPVAVLHDESDRPVAFKALAGDPQRR